MHISHPVKVHFALLYHQQNVSWSSVRSCTGLSTTQPPVLRRPWPCPPAVAGRPAAEQAMVGASAAGAGSALAGPPRHVLPLPHGRPHGVRPPQQGSLGGKAAAAGVPRRRAPRHAVPPQQRPGARQDVLLLVRADSQRDHHRPRAGQGRALQQVRPLGEAPVPGPDEAHLRRSHQP